MQHIGGALKKLIKSSGLQKGLDQQKAVDFWSVVVGENITKNTEPISVEYGILKIKVKTPAWRQELQLQKTNIINKLNNELGKKTIKDIRFI